MQKILVVVCFTTSQSLFALSLITLFGWLTQWTNGLILIKLDDGQWLTEILDELFINYVDNCNFELECGLTYR